MNDHNEHATENNNGTTGGSGNGGGNGNGANSAQQSQARHSGDDGTPKRKHDGSTTPTSTGPAQQRAKRSRYISIACNECKRRKIKCNGLTPCQRCGNLQLECLYAPNCCNLKDSEEFQSMKVHISSLQEQVDTLFANLNALRQSHGEGGIQNGMAQSPAVDPSLYNSPDDARSSLSMSRSLVHGGGGPKMPMYRGPSSSAFNFDVARSSLQTMGIASSENGLDEAVPDQQNHIDTPFQVHPDKDPLWMLKKDEVLRLCRVWEEEMGIMYPIVDLDELVQLTNMLFTFMESAVRTGLTPRHLPGSDAITGDEVNFLKLTISTTMVIESGGQNQLGKRIFENVRPYLERRLWEPADLKGVKLFAITAMYYFSVDDDILAWRHLGNATRFALELGLHRSSTLRRCFPDQTGHRRALRLFWSLYTMDRRFCFGVGLPFAIQDADIDPTMPEPEHSDSYLRSMISYFRLGSRVWYSGLGFAGNMDIKRDEIGYLDYQVLQWHRDIPPYLRYNPEDPLQDSEKISRGMRRLRVLVHIRFLHMRILIHRPLLHSASSIHENQSSASTAVELAKESIRTLARLNAVSDIYRSQQVCFNHFLVSALAVLLLAVSHDPSTYNRVVRDELFAALDLVKGFSTKSYVSKRLWEMIRGLREVANKLGIMPRHNVATNSTMALSGGGGTAAGDAHSHAAVAMAGLAGHSMDEISAYSSGMQHTPSNNGNSVPGINGFALNDSPLDGVQMSNELTSLFEAVGGYGISIEEAAASIPGGFSLGSDGETGTGANAYEEVFSRLTDMF